MSALQSAFGKSHATPTTTAMIVRPTANRMRRSIAAGPKRGIAAKLAGAIGRLDVLRCELGRRPTGGRGVAPAAT